MKKHGHLPGERARHGLGWWAAQETRPAKKTPRPLDQLLAWWRVSALLQFGQRMVDGLLQRCQAAGAAIRARVGPLVDTALAIVDVAAVVFTVRGVFSRRHVLAEARRHLMETLRGRAYVPGIDSHIADRALERYGRQLTVPQKGADPAPDQLSYTADFVWPVRWWIAGTDGKPPRESSRYERARVASLALQNAIRAALIAPPDVRDEAPAATTPAALYAVDDDRDQAAPHAVDPAGRDAALTPAQQAAAIQAHQEAAMPEEYLEGRTTDPATWMTSPQNLARIAAHTRAAEARGRMAEERADRTRRAQQAPAVVEGGQQQRPPAAQPDQGRGAGGRSR